MSDGLGFGANSRIAMITRGLVEMTRLGVALGARRETFMGLAGMGDLVLTCTDNLSSWASRCPSAIRSTAFFTRGRSPRRPSAH